MKNKRNWQLYFSFIVTIFLFVTCGEPYAEILLTQEEFVRQLKAKFPGNFKDRDFPNTFYVGNASEPEDVQAYTIQALDSKKNSSLFKRNNACDLDNDGIKEFIFLHKYEDWQGAVSMFHKSGNKYLLTDFFPLPSAVQYKIFEQAEFIPFYDKYGFKLVTSDDYQDTDLVTGAFGMQSSKNIRIFEFRNNKLFEIFYHQISGGQVELLIKDLDGDGINEIKLNSLVFSYDKKNEKYQEKTGASEISSEKYKQALYKKYREASEILKEKALIEERNFVPPSPVERIKGRVDIYMETTLFDLLAAFQDVITARHDDAIHQVATESVSIEERIAVILQLLQQREFASFVELFADVPRKIVAIVTFIAVLELVRTHRIRVHQLVPFGEVRVYRGELFSVPIEIETTALTTEPNEQAVG